MELQNGGEKNATTALLVLRVAMAVAAIALVASFFLPWASADEEYREAAAIVVVALAIATVVLKRRASHAPAVQ